jgi:hypothetical protein
MIKPQSIANAVYRGVEWQVPDAGPRQPADGEFLGYAISARLNRWLVWQSPENYIYI